MGHELPEQVHPQDGIIIIQSVIRVINKETKDSRVLFAIERIELLRIGRW